MKIEVKVPQLSESVSEATLLTWNKQIGEAVTEGENLIDIETDKVVLELPAIKSGVLTEIRKQNGDKVTSGEVIGILDTEAKASAVAQAAVAAVAAKTQAAVMPAAKKIAAEKNIDTATIGGSGRGGRVTKEDVLGASGKPAAPVASIPQPQAGGRIEQRVPMTRIRQRIAERLLQSQRVAIGSERGLVVPIIRDADKLSLADIEKQIADFAARAKEGKLTIEELTGGTFSITNGGVFGSMLSTPIINPPQSAILGIHATKDRPVAENGQVVIRPMNYLAVSYDHRIIDGREAVQFLVAIKEALEFPGRVLLDL